MVHVLAEAERDGSTCLPVAELAARAAELLGTGPPDAALLGAMADDEDARAARSTAAGAVWAYRPEVAALEAELAEQVRELAGGKPRLKAPDQPPDDALVPGARSSGRRSAPGSRRGSPSSRAARARARRRRSGCCAPRRRQQDASVALVAPTGRAARRMAESTGAEASTIHAALGWVPGQGPTRDELETDLLIVDETSMANLELLVTLLRAVGPRTHVVLVGDADQLAPVGAGKPFAELVAARAVPVAELTHIFRQAAGSMIVRGAHAVRTRRRAVVRAGRGRSRATCS